MPQAHIPTRALVLTAALKQPPVETEVAREAAQKVATPPPAKEGKVAPTINLIPNNGKWENGIPPVMGAHLMASGSVAPISTSTGCGTGEVHEFQYRKVEGEGTIMQYGNKTQVSVALTRMIEQASAEAIAERGAFTLVLSGGSLPTLLNTLVGSKGIEFDKWTVMYVDERNVPHSHPDSTHKLAMDSFLGKVGVPESQILAIQEDLPVEQAATAYAGRMMSLPESVLPRNEANLPILDMILLGIGYDGHVASLFPNTPQTSCKDGSWILPVFNSPKPPPERITMTMPVINSAKNVVMVATGESKAEIVQRTLETQTLPGAVPAQLLAPTSGKLTWILDANSCSLLSPLDWEDKKIWPRSEI